MSKNFQPFSMWQNLKFNWRRSYSHRGSGGFEKTHRYEEHIFTHFRVFLATRSAENKSTLAFRDFAKAFYTVWRGPLSIVWNFGVRVKVWNGLDKLYTNTKRNVRLGDHKPTFWYINTYIRVLVTMYYSVCRDQ